MIFTSLLTYAAGIISEQYALKLGTLGTKCKRMYSRSTVL